MKAYLKRELRDILVIGFPVMALIDLVFYGLWLGLAEWTWHGFIIRLLVAWTLPKVWTRAQQSVRNRRRKT